MAHKVETMAYANQTPWHGLGNKVSDDLSVEQMIKAAGLDWTVVKEPVYREGGVLIPNEYCLTRKPDDKVLSMAGEGYKIVQNDESMSFFKKFVDDGHMKMETAGSLWDGRYVWGLARIGRDFALGKMGEDEVRNYLLMMSPFRRGFALVFQTTSVRVVCWNTLNFALGSSLRGGGKKGDKVFRMSHASVFGEYQKAQAEEALGFATQQAIEFEQSAKFLASKRASTEAVEEYFCNVLDYDPDEAEEKADGEKKEPRALPKFREALEHAPGAELKTSLGTWWGALNAVTRVCDHENGSAESRLNGTALKNAWLGHQANIKRKAYDLALDAAGKSDKPATRARKTKVLA